MVVVVSPPEDIWIHYLNEPDDQRDAKITGLYFKWVFFNRRVVQNRKFVISFYGYLTIQKFFFRRSVMWERGVCKKRKIKATRVRVIAPAIINATPKTWFVYSSRNFLFFL